MTRSHIIYVSPYCRRQKEQNRRVAVDLWTSKPVDDGSFVVIFKACRPLNGLMVQVWNSRSGVCLFMRVCVRMLAQLDPILVKFEGGGYRSEIKVRIIVWSRAEQHFNRVLTAAKYSAENRTRV